MPPPLAPPSPSAVLARPCPRCGTPVAPQDKFCQGCGERQQVAEPAAAPTLTHIRCQNCGAEIAADPDHRSYVCPFCDSTYVVDFSPAETGRQRPEFVVGFGVTPEQALEAFRRWLSSGGLFRPGDLRRAKIEEKLKGVYLPFWSFSMLALSRWSASIGEYWWRTETYTTWENGKLVTKTRQVQETEWWDLAGQHHRYYSGYLISASRGLGREDARSLEPFKLAALKRYDPSLLAGWQCEEYSTARDDALKQCEQEFANREQAAVKSFLPGDTHSELRVASQFADVNSDLILLPVYLLTYRYRDKTYRFLLNGQTGKATGGRPVSAWRIAAAVAIGLAAVGLIALVIALASR